ncbi:MAG: hypothetical protein CM1200mP20_10770 [Pseudomonadota bacterium]|nr:MAG: hypothetical protein CM1200mP20_10770 [Pseudomonadota bacterium]
MRLDSPSISAAILHDVIEDTPTGREQLATAFGDDIARLVDGVSKIDQIEFESQEHAEAENFRKMLLAMAQDIRVILIKLADRIHNMRTLDSLKADKRKRIARQTLDIFAPIANRLGMYTWTQELEDLSLKQLYPKRYEAIRKELAKRRGNRRKIIEKTRNKIAEKVSRPQSKRPLSVGKRIFTASTERCRRDGFRWWRWGISSRSGSLSERR